MHLHPLAVQLLLDPELGVLVRDLELLDHLLERARHLELRQLGLVALHELDVALLLVEPELRVP